MRSGGCPAGSSRVQRLDPFALPVRFAASDAAADERVRDIELHRERVVVRRSVAGVRMAVNLPLSAFSGVGLEVRTNEAGAHCAVVLAHKDPGLVLPLFLSREADDAMAEWRAWAAALGLPLLLHDEETGWRERSRAHGPGAYLSDATAPPPPQRAEAAPAVASDVSEARKARCRDAGRARRARDHRAQLAAI